jgi:hypothetical protein
MGYPTPAQEMRQVMHPVGSQRTHNRVCNALICAILVGASATFASSGNSLQISGRGAGETNEVPPVIQLILRRVPEAPYYMLSLTIKNISSRSLVVNLGNNMDPTSLTLTVRGKTGSYVDWSFVEGGIAPGRVDPFVVSLPPGAALYLPLDLREFGAPPNYEGLRGLSSGNYTVKATLQGSAVNPRSLSSDAHYFEILKYWTGKSVSSPVQMVVP